LHIAAGRWISAHLALPTEDPFSHSLAGATWVPHEWLAEVVLAAVFWAAGWSGLVVLTAACFGATMAILTRFLLRHFEPFSALIAVTLGAALVLGHLLARPHILALPLLVIWCGALIRSRDAGEAPPLLLLPLMALCRCSLEARPSSSREPGCEKRGAGGSSVCSPSRPLC